MTTLKKFIEMLQDHMAHGANPEAIVIAYDADLGDMVPVTGLVTGPDEIEICTDEC